jgi:uncharacterized protein YkwD
MQTARGLAAAHAQGLVHRDIKPANILLENGVERVKITDFGLARAVDDASMTQSGTVAGTPMYMSPEQANGDTVDARSDLFSLGSTMYAMCTGHPPFRASTSMAVMKRVTEEQARPIRESNPEIPDWLEAIVGKLHAKKPTDRFQSATGVAELLEQHLAHLQTPHAVPLPAKVEVPMPGHTIPWWKVAFVVLLLGFGAWRWGPHLVLTAQGQAAIEVQLTDSDAEFLIKRSGKTLVTAKTGTIYITPGLYTFEVRPRPSRRVDTVSYLHRTYLTGHYLPSYSLDSQEMYVGRGHRVRLVIGFRNEAVEQEPGKKNEAGNRNAPIPPTTEKGWTSLFNGKDLTGWKTHPKQPGDWKVENGILIGRGPTTHLFTERGDFHDFHLRAEVMINVQGDSGIWFRTGFDLPSVSPLTGIRYPDGYEAQIIGRSSGDEKGRRTGSIIPLQSLLKPIMKADEWFTLEILAKDKRLITRINGELACDCEEEKALPRLGHLALQGGGSTRPTTVQFRKVEIKTFTKVEVKLTPLEQSLLDAINQERTKAKLSALQTNPKLLQAARRHADDMARWDQLTHKIEDKDLPQRLKEVGYTYRAIGENVAVNQQSAKEALEAWLVSKGHKENLLNPTYTEVGLGVSVSQTKMPYYAVIFATPTDK